MSYGQEYDHRCEVQGCGKPIMVRCSCLWNGLTVCRRCYEELSAPREMARSLPLEARGTRRGTISFLTRRAARLDSCGIAAAVAGRRHKMEPEPYVFALGYHTTLSTIGSNLRRLRQGRTLPVRLNHRSRASAAMGPERAPAVRQSVYSRLAGYEDVNDAERLSQDPAFRLIGSSKIWER